MAKNYVIYGFSYINDETGMNTLNGTKGVEWEEINEEYEIVCFNGLAYFKSVAGYFKLTYPKFQNLTWDDKESVYTNNGYYPNGGEYGAICSTFGDVERITEDEFNQLMKDYPIKKKDYQYLEWL